MLPEITDEYVQMRTTTKNYNIDDPQTGLEFVAGV